MNEYESFCNNKLFRGFEPNELKALYAISRPITLKAGETLIHEGEKGDELFFIIQGALEVVKLHRTENTDYVIETLSAGETVGELSFIDRGFRSATVKAKTETNIRIIAFKDLERFVDQSPEYSRIYIHLSKNVSQRLRKTSNTALESLKNEARENKTRVNMGLFLIYIITALCLFSYALNSLRYLVRAAPSSIYVALPVTFIVGTYLLILMKISSLPWSEFGITLSNWKRALFEGIVFPIPLMGLCLFFKWLLILFHPSYAGHTLFEPFAVIQDPTDRTWTYWIAANAVYCFFMVPIQELLTRGALQGLLQDFLYGKHKTIVSIFASNLIFSTIHVYFSLHIGVIVFFGGMYIGWIYSRTHTLISSTIAHAILGVWFLSVLGSSIAIQRI